MDNKEEVLVATPDAETAIEKPKAPKTRKRSPRKSTKSRKKKLTLLEKMRERRENRRVAAREAKIAREKQNAKKRVELAKLKKARKTEREKLIAERNEKREERRAQLIRSREEHKREAAKRRELLRSETKKQREKRIKEERAARLQEKKERRELRAEALREKRENRLAMREAKIAERERKRKENRGVGGWIAAVVSLGVSVLVLGTLVTIGIVDNATSMGDMEDVYSRSFYNLTNLLNNMDVNLSKLTVSSSSEEQQTILMDIIVESELIESNLEQLPIEDEDKASTVKLVNQVGDYSKSLNKKLASGEALGSDEAAKIEAMSGTVSSLATEINETANTIKDGKNLKFSALLKKNNNLITDSFTKLTNASADYPQMIYDGPFSDGLDEREIKGLSGGELSKEDAVARGKEYLMDYELSELYASGEAVTKSIACYVLEGKTLSGVGVYLQLAKRGGKPVLFTLYDECEEDNFSDEECIKIGEEFLSSIGYEGMKAVWQNENNNVLSVNYAFCQEGAVVYSDLIKVKVCKEKGKVVGIEAITYLTNHTGNRDVSSPNISAESARKTAENKIDVSSVRLAVIPLGVKSEVLAYEVSGTYNDNLYYIYINALTGKEAQIFKVVKTTEGTLLL